VRRLGQRLAQHLQIVDGRADGRGFAHESELAEQRIFDVRITASLADAHALGIHRHAATDDEIDRHHLAERRRHAVAGGAVDAGG
jgi:hypothetical protein